METAVLNNFQIISVLSIASSFSDVPFSPVRLICLIGWVYICLYFVQRTQFSPLVSQRYKPAANLIALVLGPTLLFLLLLFDTAMKLFKGKHNALEIISEQLQNVFWRVGLTPKPLSKIKLLDSSGRSLHDIYTAGKIKRQDSKILDLVEQVICNALDDDASDILIDPKDDSHYTVRYRVDGVLRLVYDLNSAVCKSLINSLKALSEMDISEKRRPQDGSFTAQTEDSSFSFRVASAGTRSGEKLSIRILGQNAGVFTLENIGLTEKQQDVIKSYIDKPLGMILICGPTGSGKTTTLYSMLNKIDVLTRNVITVEDPIEYIYPNASQIEVNFKANITFAGALRSILRQDPNVICVGEIRDEETAAMALRAAQTGHLVIATIHCGSNASAVVRLMDLRVTPLLISSGLNLLISQRLLRVLCDKCKRPAQLTLSQKHDFHKKHIDCSNIFQATGCKDCDGTGYSGRTGIFDLLPVTDELKVKISTSQALLTELRKNGDKKGMSNLYKQGLKKVVCGMTTFEELHRVVGEAEDSI